MITLLHKNYQILGKNKIHIGTSVTKISSIQIVKRYYPVGGNGKDKIITLLSKTLLAAKMPMQPSNIKSINDVLGVTKEISDPNSFYNTIPGLPVLMYKSEKIKQQMEQNYILKKRILIFFKI